MKQMGPFRRKVAAGIVREGIELVRKMNKTGRISSYSIGSLSRHHYQELVEAKAEDNFTIGGVSVSTAKENARQHRELLKL